jgi:alkylhydroperoxidase family enzyme
MRLQYAANPPQTTTAEEAEILSAIQARRAPGPLQPIDLALLHAPPIAFGWSSFLGAVRNKSTLPADIREISVLRVAALCGSKYEIDEHTPYAKRAGVSERDISAVLNGSRGDLNDVQWAALRFAEAMTVDVKVSQEIFDELKQWLSDRQMVEVTATIAALNCAARFLVALNVGELEEE